jgi:hypothetical protein
VKDLSVKECPFCAEAIQDDAVKCRHCGSTLVGSAADWQQYRLRYQRMTLDEQRQAWAKLSAAQQSQLQRVLSGQAATSAGPEQGVRLWSPGVAAVLSLVIPGAGQIYKGQVAIGLLWLLFVVVGYTFLIVPGLILHLVCIVTAASGDPTRSGG